MGHQKSDIPALKEHLDQLRQAMIQKTAGQRRDGPKSYVPLEGVGTIVNCIVIETMCLYLSGDLDKLEALVEGAVEKATPAWIPTSERMPGTDKLVLVVRSDGDMAVAGWNAALGWLHYWSGFRVKNVTHWMPLPEPPKEEEEE